MKLTADDYLKRPDVRPMCDEACKANGINLDDCYSIEWLPDATIFEQWVNGTLVAVTIPRGADV